MPELTRVLDVHTSQPPQQTLVPTKEGVVTPGGTIWQLGAS